MDSMIDLVVTLINATPDAIRMVWMETDAVEVLRRIAQLAGMVLFEDGSIG